MVIIAVLLLGQVSVLGQPAHFTNLIQLPLNLRHQVAFCLDLSCVSNLLSALAADVGRVSRALLLPDFLIVADLAQLLIQKVDQVFLGNVLK